MVCVYYSSCMKEVKEGNSKFGHSLSFIYVRRADCYHQHRLAFYEDCDDEDNNDNDDRHHHTLVVIITIILLRPLLPLLKLITEQISRFF